MIDFLLFIMACDTEDH